MFWGRSKSRAETGNTGTPLPGDHASARPSMAASDTKTSPASADTPAPSPSLEESIQLLHRRDGHTLDRVTSAGKLQPVLAVFDPDCFMLACTPNKGSAEAFVGKCAGLVACSGACNMRKTKLGAPLKYGVCEWVLHTAVCV